MNDSIAKRARAAFAALSLVVAIPACVASADFVSPLPVRGTGTLTQRWSIGGRFDPGYCAIYAADKMELVIKDTAGNVVARAYQPCREMEMTVTLPVGSYVADAVLIGSDGSTVSTTLPLQPFRVYERSDTFVDTDFPTSSMLTVLGLRLSRSGDELPEDDDAD